MPEMSKHRRGQATGRGRFEPQLHDYGPHVDPDPIPTHDVWVSKRTSDGTAEVEVHASVLRQRRRINDLAHAQALARRAAAVDTPADG